MSLSVIGEPCDSPSRSYHKSTTNRPASATLRDPVVLASAAARLLARRNGDPVLDPTRDVIARRLIRRAVIAELARSLSTGPALN